MKNLVGIPFIFLLFLLPLFSSCDGGGGGGRAANAAPTVNITSPADGAEFLQGNPVVFRGTATDPEDGALTGTSLVWTSSIDDNIGTGTSCTRNDLSVGTHTITLTATDSGGKSASHSITIRIRANQPPTASITSPADGTTFLQGSAVTFQGSATDPEDGALTGASLVWTSSLDGDIGTGESFSRNDLSLGFHVITLTATDSGGGTGSDSVTIRIRAPNQPPTATIVSPPDGATFGEGSSVLFQGSGTDSEDGILSGSSLSWRSSLDGDIGTGWSFTRDHLSVGTHTITLTATDSEGATGSDAVTIEILHVNRPPVVTITSPADGGTYLAETSVIFEGSATDPEDGPLTGSSLVWTSSLDGDIGTGESFMRDDLSLGTHTITLTASDSESLYTSELLTVNITDEIPAGEGRIYLLKTDADGNLEWERTFGGATVVSTGLGGSVVQTTDGGYAIVAGLGGYWCRYVYLLKTDPAGVLEWSRAYGGSEHDMGYSVQQTADGGYILAGETQSFGAGGSDVYLVKTDYAGRLEWQTTAGGTEWDYGFSVQEAADGGYAVAGSTSSFGAGSSDVYLLRTTSSGELDWHTTFGGAHMDKGFCVDRTADVGYVITGVSYASGGGGAYQVYLLKTDSRGGLEWETFFGGDDYCGISVQQTSDGGYTVAGRTKEDLLSVWPEPSDAYLAKTDSLGNVLWERTFGTAFIDLGSSVVESDDGGYVLAGGISTSVPTDPLDDSVFDVYLVKTDSLGNLIWEKTFGGEDGDWGIAVQQTTDGGYVVAGYTHSFGTGLGVGGPESRGEAPEDNEQRETAHRLLGHYRVENVLK